MKLKWFMFINNKYSKIYFSIIEKARFRNLNTYYEIHHIIPKCLGGSDNLENLIELTPREHFICHLLLIKMKPDHIGIKFALHMMTHSNKYHQRDYKITARVYDYIKKLNSEASSSRNANRVYEKGRKRYYDTRLNKYKMIRDGDYIPDYFTEGWNQDFKNIVSEKNRKRKYYYDPITFEVRAFLDEQIIPLGWLKGNPNADTSDVTNIRGTKYYHNPITGEEKRLFNCPDGWVNGRILVWVTDGVINKQQNKYEPILNGFRCGRTSVNIGKKYDKSKK